MAIRIRLVPLAVMTLVAAAGLAACRPADGGQDATSVSPSAAPTDATAETPPATVDSDDPY